jgi:hypothetical protein
MYLGLQKKFKISYEFCYSLKYPYLYVLRQISMTKIYHLTLHTYFALMLVRLAIFK